MKDALDKKFSNLNRSGSAKPQKSGTPMKDSLDTFKGKWGGQSKKGKK